MFIFVRRLRTIHGTKHPRSSKESFWLRYHPQHAVVRVSHSSQVLLRASKPRANSSKDQNLTEGCKCSVSQDLCSKHIMSSLLYKSMAANLALSVPTVYYELSFCLHQSQEKYLSHCMWCKNLHIPMTVPVEGLVLSTVNLLTGSYTHSHCDSSHVKFLFSYSQNLRSGVPSLPTVTQFQE